MRPDPDAIEASRPGDREVALLAAEVRRLQAVIASGEPTLTDAERQCLEEAIYRVAEHDNESDGWKSYTADTLRGLLARTK